MPTKRKDQERLCQKSSTHTNEVRGKHHSLPLDACNATVNARRALASALQLPNMPGGVAHSYLNAPPFHALRSPMSSLVCAQEQMYTSSPLNEYIACVELLKKGDCMKPEKRKAGDGFWYTKKEFFEWFGRLDEWDVAARDVRPKAMSKHLNVRPKAMAKRVDVATAAQLSKLIVKLFFRFSDFSPKQSESVQHLKSLLLDQLGVLPTHAPALLPSIGLAPPTTRCKRILPPKARAVRVLIGHPRVKLEEGVKVFQDMLQCNVPPSNITLNVAATRRGMLW